MSTFERISVCWKKKIATRYRRIIGWRTNISPIYLIFRLYRPIFYISLDVSSYLPSHVLWIMYRIYTNKSSYNLRYHSFRFQSRRKADLDYDPEFHRNDRRLLIKYDHFSSFHKSAWIKDEIIVKRKWEMSLVLIEKHSNFLFLKFVSFLFPLLDSGWSCGKSFDFISFSYTYN